MVLVCASMAGLLLMACQTVGLNVNKNKDVSRASNLERGGGRYLAIALVAAVAFVRSDVKVLHEVIAKVITPKNHPV